MLSRVLRSRLVTIPRPAHTIAYRQLFSRTQYQPLVTAVPRPSIFTRSFSSFRDYKPKKTAPTDTKGDTTVDTTEESKPSVDSSPSEAAESKSDVDSTPSEPVESKASESTTPNTEDDRTDAQKKVEEWLRNKAKQSPEEMNRVKERVKQAENEFTSSSSSNNSRDSNSNNNSEDDDKSSDNKSSDNKSSDDKGAFPNSDVMMYVVAGTALFIVFGGRAGLLGDSSSVEEVSVAEFCTRLMSGDPISKIVVRADKETVAVYQSGQSVPSFIISIGSIDSFERVMKEVQYAAGLDPNEFIPVYFEPVPSSVNLQWMLEMAFFGVVLYAFYIGFGMMNKGGGLGGRNPFSMGKATFKAVMPGDKTSVKFADVAGLNDAKVEVMEFVEFLKDADRFTRLGAKVPKGALLVGPPGTGKTLLAKATAGEAGVPFYSVSGSEFLEMFVGVGPARVRDLFKEARANKPSIIFIDEIDAVGRARSNDSRRGGSNDERENTLNQLLVEMDGFNSDTGVIVLAGTNRADVLDNALTRPGRFDRTIQVDNPDIQGRVQIFGVHLKNLKTSNDKNDLAPKLAALTPGFSGADIANICNEAAIIAGRSEKESVEEVDFERAVDRVIGGLEKPNIMSQAEKKLVAYHEAGHAVVGWFLEHADPLLKVTIVPRGGGALGFAQYLPKELSLYQQDQLEDRMCVMLGGRAAEQVCFGKVSTGASDDLQKVMQLANNVVTRFGMTGALPNLAFKPQDQFNRPFSQGTAGKVDKEIFSMINGSYERTLALLDEKKEQLEALAEKLMELETINHQHIVDCLGPRPFKTDAYTQFLSNEHKRLPTLANYNITTIPPEAATDTTTDTTTEATDDTTDTATDTSADTTADTTAPATAEDAAATTQATDTANEADRKSDPASSSSSSTVEAADNTDSSSHPDGPSSQDSTDATTDADKRT